MRQYLLILAIAFVAALAPVFVGHAGLDWLVSPLVAAWPVSDSFFAQACAGDPATGLAAHHLILTLLWLAGLVVLGTAYATSRNRIDRRLDPSSWRLRYLVPIPFVLFGLYGFGPLVSTFGDAFECGRGRGLIPTFLLTFGLLTAFIVARFVIFATSETPD